MHYDSFDRLIQSRTATDLGADTILYGYNAAGMRIYKAFRHHYRARCLEPALKDGDDPDPGPEPIPFWCIFSRLDITYYDLAGEKTLRERTSGPHLSKSSNYIYSGNSRIAMRDEQERLHYFLNDHLGSTRVVIDSTGLVEDKYWYYCFGGTWNEEVSLNQPYRYTAKPLDNEDGLNIYYYGARYYDADLGRFLALDPAASKYPSLSPYAYCANNPLKSVDVDGATFMDRIVGVFVAELDNATGLNLRGCYTPTDPGDYNAGQDGGDLASGFLGTLEMAIGSGMEGGGAVATAATAGAGAEVTVPVMGGGVLLQAHGVFNLLSAAANLGSQKGRVQGGNYSDLPEPSNVGPGKDFSPSQKQRILDENARRNGGTVRSDQSGRQLDPASKAQKGVKANMNQAEVDHVRSKSKGGSNSNSNAQVLSKKENLEKGVK